MGSSEFQGRLSLLAVVAHPHDITHVAGTCAHHIQRGDAVTAVSASGGVRTHNERLYDELLKAVGNRNNEILAHSPEEYGERKCQEMIEVCRLFGITDVRVLPFRDQPLSLTDELVRTLAEILYEVRPDLLITHAPYKQVSKGRQSIHPDDHVSTGIAVQRALEIVETPDSKSRQRPHKVAAVYYTGVEFSYRDIDLFIDITDQADNRLKAEELFTTQGHTAEFAAKRVEIGCGFFGWHAGVGYAEPFVRADERAVTARYLLVTDYEMERAEQTQKKHLEKVSQRVSRSKGR